MKIARVFPSRTEATPDDPLAFVGWPDLFAPEVDEVHVSGTWDMSRIAISITQRQQRGAKIENY